jgi:thiol-disulfide isomerase/thioredoxin
LPACRYLRLALVAVALGPCLAVGGKVPAPPAEVRLQAVRKDDFVKALAAQRGKVVVLDVWADFCVPCKREFPHLVALHRKYAGQGLTAVSVSVDPAEDQGKALRFLRKVGAAFPNYLFDEKVAVWQEHFDIYGPPAVLVFGRDGKLAGRFDHNDVNKVYSYDDVEKLVRKLLARKG